MRTFIWYIAYCSFGHTTNAYYEPWQDTQPFIPPVFVDQTIINSGTCPGNTPQTRDQWCQYDLYTDYTDTVPDTGVTREFWLNVHQANLAPDGRSRWMLAINNSMPGPTIEADWGDTVIIHLRSSLPPNINNGTSLHIHGLRQHFTNPMDGVVSVTQCPLAPGNVMSYRWRATQYGTTWYHSHIGLQTWEGVYGGVIINGPASSNYDEDKGVILLSDWDINTVDQLWTQAQTVGAPQLDNGLINGHNVFGGDNGSIQTGYRFNVSFVSGASYRLRVTNVACDTQFKFSIDHHSLTVISMDFVPIKPYRTTVINISIGQRYDVIVQADQESIAKSFWLRAIPQLSCSTNSNAENIRGIINYGIGSATSLPNTTSYTITDTCEDEPASKLSPIISKDLSLTASDFYYNEDLPASVAQNENSVFRWYLNGTSMQVTWYQPTLMDFVDKGQGYYGGAVEPPDPTQPSRAVISVRKAETWVLVIIETTVQAPHPIHLHGHDFLVVAQGSGAWNVDTNTLNLDYAAGSLPKRDTALLPALGHLVLAFRTDNPGAWLMHCHIGWHIDQGFALQFVEREDEIRGMLNVYGNALGGWWEYGKAMKENCDIWNRYDPGGQILVNGAGI